MGNCLWVTKIYPSLSCSKFRRWIRRWKSDEDKNHLVMNGDAGKMAVADVAFRAIPKNSTCFLVWRVEKLQLVPVPRDKYGSLYTGDSYVVLSISEVGDRGGSHIKAKEAKRALDAHIHFWLGKTTSQDEAGVAAYKTVELDDFLGGYPVQHREVQGYESKRFVAYFKDGIRYLEGGVASGFHHVVTDTEPVMFLVKGKRRPLIRQLPNISWSAMNDGDVFVIDTKQVIFVWTGRRANNMEKIQGAKVAQKLKSEHGPTANIVIVEDGGENSLPKSEREYLNNLLPLGAKKVKPQSEAETDEVVERRQAHDMKLYRCSDEGGTLKVTEVKSRPLHQRDLLSQDSFIIDNGANGIWVWVGKRASQKERSEAMRNAQGFVKKKGYPNYTQVTRVIDGGEPLEFKALFQSWKEVDQTVGLGRSHSRGTIAKTVQTKFDAATLHENAPLAARTQMIDDGAGKKEVWRIENFDLVAVSPKQYGRFFGGDCYVIKYTYHNGSRENCILYYWLGKRSSVDERGTAALKTIELDDAMGGSAIQVRVIQGKEPPHFMTIFGGRLVIFGGGKASGFRQEGSNNSTIATTPDPLQQGPGDTYMLQVAGTSSMNTRAVQVEMRAASLNSNDVFVLVVRGAVYIWAGRGSTGDEREMAKMVATESSTREAVLMYEGQEKEDFWEVIGGKENYSNDKRLADPNTSHPPRLFHCSNASGRFRVEEISDFDQSDLIEEDVMLLDAWDAIFIWIGRQSNAEERQLAEQTAEEYLRTDPSGRDIHTPIYRLKQGYEPPNFTGFFGVWDRSQWNNNQTYDQLKEELAQDNPGMITLHTNGPTSAVTNSDVPRFSLEVLTEKDPEKLPEEIDPSQKEIYLSDEEFEELFHMKLIDFENLPKWKKVALKKKVGLF